MRKKTRQAESPLGMTSRERQIVDEFHRLWHPLQEVWWRGVFVNKCPLDMLIYQEIIYENRPDCIIETGTLNGGSALYMAHLCDLNQHGMVVTVDVNRLFGFPQHNRILYVTGSSTDKKVFEQVEAIAKSFRKVMVLLDSDHTKPHVLKELELYGPLVTPRQYLIVEDTDIHGHPVREELPPGPWEALEAWLPKHPEFVVDKSCERFLVTQNPGGYLRRKENA